MGIHLTLIRDNEKREENLSIFSHPTYIVKIKQKITNAETRTKIYKFDTKTKEDSKHRNDWKVRIGKLKDD